MKVGDYVRTKDGKIVEIIDIGEYLGMKQYLINENGLEYIIDNSIVKSSPNIIDLIEVGDFVNGLKVAQIIEVEGYKVILMFGLVMRLGKEDIKTIVTKEQFSQMEYRIGE